MKIDIEDYYHRYGPMVYRRCLFLLQDEDKAYDAMQDVFVKLIKNKNRLHGKYPSSLLFRIATNTCLNIIQSDKHLTKTDDDFFLKIKSIEDIESSFIAKDLLDHVFSGRKESTRMIAVMYYIDRMTHNEIALEMGMSVSGVRKRLRTLKEKLKEDKGIYFE